MEILELHFRGALLSRYELTERALELGSDQGCDLVVAAPDLAPRHYLIMRQQGSVHLVDVSGGSRSHGKQVRLVPGQPRKLGVDYSLLRRSQAGCAQGSAGGTQRLQRPAPAEHFVLRVGPGAEARQYRIDQRPLCVGRGEGNDLVLYDRSVSARHCRIEPAAGGVVVRDLGSSNGTHVDGVRVEMATLRAGGRLRLGQSELRLLSRGSEPAGPSMVAESPAMLEVMDDARRVAALPWPALVLGESGTGKEGVAAAIHQLSERRAGPYVAVNAGGLGGGLVDSELFGHERGAFTGASGLHRGAFEQGHGGTLFLDEIGELPLASQARLLRVLETGELRRVGAERTLRVSTRLVCATHRDLRGMVRDGTFRQDLYYRVARLVIEVPALRTRTEDVRALAHHFLRQAGAELGERQLSDAAETRLVAYDWPGNARELRNVVCAAASSSASSTIEALDVERALCRVGSPVAEAPLDAEGLQRAVAVHGGNLAAAARALGMPRSTLRDRLRTSAA